MTPGTTRSAVAVVDDDRASLQATEYRLASADHAAPAFDSAMELSSRGAFPTINRRVCGIDMPRTDGPAQPMQLRWLRPRQPAVLITARAERHPGARKRAARDVSAVAAGALQAQR